MRELGIDINVVTGTSIGAINGAMITQGDYDIALSLWNRIETAKVMDMPISEEQTLKKKVWQTYQSFAVNFVKSGGTDTNPLKQTLEAYIDEERIRKSDIEYGLVTVEMDTNIPCELFGEDIPNGKLIDYMIASASIYPAFKSHRIDDVRYLDGAYYDNLPVKMALEKGADYVIAVDLEAFGVVRKEMLALADRLTYIRCYWNLGPTLVFDRTVIRRNIRLGYLDALKAFQAVMLMDIEKAREIIKPVDVFKCVKEHEAELVLPDQDVFNYLYGARTVQVDDAIWNYDARDYSGYLLKSGGAYDMD